MPQFLGAVCIFLAFLNFSLQAGTWQVKKTPHFEIYHESDWTPHSIAIELERIYGQLRMNLSMFAPWMVTEKTRIYIHRNKNSYLNGEFNPPAWSKGLAFFDKKAVVVYDSGDLVKLRAVITHELTHLYFESFYAESLKFPPQWLNEGLAVLMEDASYSRGKGPWSAALKYAPEERFENFEVFSRVDLRNMRNESVQKIGDWYLHAFGIAGFLYGRTKRIQFKNFCVMNRKGETLEKSLWEAYRYKNPRHFEDEWRKWLRTYGAKETDKFSSGFSSASFEFIPFKSK
ncbi:MAG: hypothetical protein HY746_01655 [Elusimicrobia bacterium]|nr:hypothetical protein [Elusimicrobiota bacterium]